MICQKCGSNNPSNAYFCCKCGTPLYQNKSVRIPNNQQHISNNQTQYISITSDKSLSKAKKLCWLGVLAIFMLPVAGWHRLYVGKILTGLIYMCTFGLFFIGTIYDLIQLSLGQFTDNVGQPLRK